jgi:DNA-binding winged helix-turn-helix (wHTH) protein
VLDFRRRRSVGDSMNDTSARVSRLVRFGVFEIDLRSGELRKSGVRLNLQQQPLQLLSVLLEQPGDLVTREELRRRLWHDDTFVDFDHGLNAAVKRLRDTLGDSAESPRFIETVARRGYRFIAPASEPDVVEATGAQRGSLLWRIVWAATGMGTAALITVILVGRARPSALPGPLLATSIFVDGVALNLTQHGVHFAVAPSGRTVVFTGSHGGQSILYRRDLDRLEREQYT